MGYRRQQDLGTSAVPVAHTDHAGSSPSLPTTLFCEAKDDFFIHNQRTGRQQHCNSKGGRYWRPGAAPIAIGWCAGWGWQGNHGRGAVAGPQWSPQQRCLCSTSPRPRPRGSLRSKVSFHLAAPTGRHAREKEPPSREWAAGTQHPSPKHQNTRGQATKQPSLPAGHTPQSAQARCSD